MTSPISISPKYTVDDWRRLKFESEADWDAAASMLEDRIQGRYLNVVMRFKDHKYAGFAIMALDCLLIETLEQFRKGVAETPSGKGKTYFVDFLTGTSFAEYFTVDTARKFYKLIRCGVLHQAEVKERSLILRDPAVPMVKLSEVGTGLEINRNKFHDELVKVFDQYISSVRNPGKSDLREKFRRKMDIICNEGNVC